MKTFTTDLRRPLRPEEIVELAIALMTDKGRRSLKRDSWHSIPGIVARRRNTTTKTTTSLYRAAAVHPAKGEAASHLQIGSAYTLVCEDHGTTAGAKSLEEGKYRMLSHPEKWCPSCEEIHSKNNT